MDGLAADQILGKQRGLAAAARGRNPDQLVNGEPVSHCLSSRARLSTRPRRDMVSLAEFGLGDRARQPRARFALTNIPWKVIRFWLFFFRLPRGDPPYLGQS